VSIDLHCHILPRLDDGPPTIEESDEQASAHVAAGVTAVVATPHVRADLPQNTSKMIHAATVALRLHLERCDVPLEVHTGAEVDLAHACELDDAELSALTIAGRRWLLVEAPLSPRPTDAEVLFGLLRSRGHQLVIAHPERCPQFQRRPESLRSLVDGGALTQITASALDGAFGNTARRYARWMLEERLAHVIASDAHDSRVRPPGLRRSLIAAGAEHLEAWLGDEAPAAIVAGAETVARPPALSRRGLGRLRRGA
jgi:protein-tyrosine phosphatase